MGSKRTTSCVAVLECSCWVGKVLLQVLLATNVSVISEVTSIQVSECK